jgi:multidrug efflux pump subunit AcrA (membrane-fusion protein)
VTKLRDALVGNRWRTAAIVLVIALIALAIAAIGLLVARSNLSQQLTAATDDIDAVTRRRDELQEQVNDRESQRRADEAAAARLAAEQAEKQQRTEEEAARAAVQQAAAQEAQAAARRTLPGNGIVAIGSEKEPGTYRTDGPASGSSCYYAVLSRPTGGGVDNIIDNNHVRGPAIVQLAPGQYFESSRCQSWTIQ